MSQEQPREVTEINQILAQARSPVADKNPSALLIFPSFDFIARNSISLNFLPLLFRNTNQGNIHTQNHHLQ